MTGRKCITVLMADDDADDRQMARDSFLEHRLLNVKFVADGVELMDYLERKNQYASVASSPRPGVILLDLNMPRKNGYEALAEIQASPSLKRIPVVVLTTSGADSDIAKAYTLGAKSFITKPIEFEAFSRVIKEIDKYWFEIVEPPPIE